MPHVIHMYNPKVGINVGYHYSSYCLLAEMNSSFLGNNYEIKAGLSGDFGQKIRQV